MMRASVRPCRSASRADVQPKYPETSMSSKFTAVRAAAALVAASAPLVALAQAPAGSPPSRPLSRELAALNPPVRDDTKVTDERRTPAEKKAAAYVDRKWTAPKTSWGHPNLEGVFATDDMRGIPFDRPEELGAQEFLNEQQFAERAKRQQAGSDHAANEETFHRNTWGVRSFGFTSLVVDPPNGRTPALTADGRARAAAVAGKGSFGSGPFDTFEDFSLYDRCIARSLSAGMSAVLYGNGILIRQSPDSVTITYEMIHETRVIRLDDRPHLDGLAQYNGNSRGHWEGDTLVVDTSGFTDKTSIGGGAPNSPRLRTTERIRRVDPDMIEYRITVDDPATYTAPFTVRTMWTTQPSLEEVYEYACHEGNYAVSGGLAGERTFERDVAEAKAKGLPIPRRSSMTEVYSAPPEGAEVFNINKGE
jgi:hypothetical protein